MLLDKFGSFIHFTDGHQTTMYSRSTFLVASEEIVNVSSFAGTSFQMNSASISIPSRLIEELSISDSASSIRFVYSVFPNDSTLFYTPGVNVTSTIIGSTIPGVEVNNLSENNTIRIMFTATNSRVSLNFLRIYIVVY